MILLKLKHLLKQIPVLSELKSILVPRQMTRVCCRPPVWACVDLQREQLRSKGDSAPGVSKSGRSNPPHWRSKTDLQGLAGDDGGHLLLGHPPHHHRGQLDLRVDLGQPHQLGDGERLERGQPLLVVGQGTLRSGQLVVDVPEADQQQSE